MALPYEEAKSGERAVRHHSYNFVNIAGQTFGLWTAIRHIGGRQWECRCSCGGIHHVGSSQLRLGKSKSCKRCALIGHKFKHGNASERLGFSKKYRTWLSILCRVRDKTSPRSRWYKDITICKEWESDFEAFDRDVPDPPSEKHTIDRINNALGYQPGNVRWATMKEQANNRRNSKSGRTILEEVQAKNLLPVPKEGNQ